MSKIKLKLDLSGKDSTFLSNCHRYHRGLSAMAMYRTVPEKVPNLEQLKQAIDEFERRYEGAVNRDRIQITMRNEARKILTEMFEKVRSYLQSVAGEDDMPELLQAGFEVTGRQPRRKTAAAPVGG